MTTENAAADSPVALATTDISRIAQDLQIRRNHIERAIELLDQGNTIPFILRYRKAAIGGMSEVPLRRIQERVHGLRSFHDRKQSIIKSIESQGKLTDELKAAVLSADSSKRLDDLYLPFKPKRKSLAGEARDRGLEPFALAIWSNDPVAANRDEVLAGLVNPEKQINTTEDALLGTKNIIIEMIAEQSDVRGTLRRWLWDNGRLIAGRHEKLPEGKGLDYKDFFQFSEPLQKVPAHRILALNRGERENALTIKIDYDRDSLRQIALQVMPNWAEHPHRDILESCFDDSLAIVLPVLEREIRRELTEGAQHHAVEVFASNLRGLLMQRPLPGKRMLAIDPGFRAGCRLVALDDKGNPMEDGIVFPHMPQKKRREAKLILEQFIRRHQPDIIAIGNGSGCRETEEFVAEVIAICDKRRRGEPVPDDPEPPKEKKAAAEKPSDPAVVSAPEGVVFTPGSTEPTEAKPESSDAQPAQAETSVQEKPPADTKSEIEILKSKLEGLPPPPSDIVFVAVNEAGASDYSSSAVGREELPQFDTSVRAAISIGRRLQDPLAELVKIDPQHVGVGLYQHDVHGKHLKGALEAVIESCVNHVGVDLNSASVSLLRHVAGFNQHVAREIVEHRQKSGPFRTLAQLAELPIVGPERYVQAAGFLKIADGDEPLDVTTIHPEHYELARAILSELEFAPTDLRDPDRLQEFRNKLAPIRPKDIAAQHKIDEPQVWELLDALTQPGRDPREDMPLPIFRRDVLKFEDLQPGMELKGTVLNVVDFGAFVDVGLKDSGLVHISQLANRYIRNPHELVSVGDVVTVWVMKVEGDRKRVSLTMLPPNPPKEEPRPRSFGSRDARPPQPSRQEHQPRQQRRQPRRQPREERVEVVSLDGPPAQRNTARFERKPPRPPKPLPTLTKEKKEGKAYLNTLGELEAFFKQRESGEPGG